MAWKETSVLEERMRFVLASREGSESHSALCRRFGISRPTGYKWLERYAAEGPSGLEDRSRAPLRPARVMDSGITARLIEVRLKYPHWGPRKVRAYLADREPETHWPAASTIGLLFDREGLTRHRRKRRRVAETGRPFGAVTAPGEVWCVDFKGWFLTGDGIRVDPLTLSDAHSRYLIACEAVNRPDGAHVWPVLERSFHEQGLPLRLRSDNGPPFAGTGAGGLTWLAVQVIKAGVGLERIRPGKPQENGRHERMHLTLKKETASPPAASLLAQMRRFEEFRAVYNEERPHEALGQVPPARVHVPSGRTYDGRPRPPEYDEGVQVRRVRRNGEIKWRGELVYVSGALRGEPVGLTEVADDTFVLEYGPVLLGTLKGKDRLRPARAGRSKTGPGGAEHGEKPVNHVIGLKC